MKIICLASEMVIPAVRYSLEFILNSNGYFFEWKNEPEPGNLHITYGTSIIPEISAESQINLPSHYTLDMLHRTKILWQEIKIGGRTIPVITNKSSDPEIPFDLLATVFYHLTRVEESEYSNPDDVDIQMSNHCLFKYGQFKIPVVDVLCRWFYDLLASKKVPLLRKAVFPSGEQCGVAVTHDIDRLFTINPIKRYFKMVTRVRAMDNSAYMRIFEKLVSDYKRSDIKATFFFLAKKMENKSYRYRINNKKLRELLRFLNRNNHEVALHSSRYAFDNNKRYMKEKKRLENGLGQKVEGLRQHYIRCLFPGIWRIAAAADFSYNSSLVYRRMSGFRAGTSHPFRCFDHMGGEEIPVVECPVLFFENTLPHDGKDVDKSLSEIRELFDEVNEYQGVLVALWHQDNIYDNGVYQEIWHTFLELLANKYIYIATLKEQVDWYILRNKITMESFEEKKGRWSVTLDIPEGIKKLTLILPEEFDRVNVAENAFEYQCKGTRLFINTGGQARKLIVYLENSH